MTQETYDVVVLGGGAAGLSGALVLGRARRSVLVVDAGEPRNAPAGHVHNYLGREGTPPGELLAAGRAEVAAYGGGVVAGRAEAAARVDGGFLLTLADGSVVPRAALVVAPRFVARSGVLAGLGLEPAPMEREGSDIGSHVAGDPMGATAVPGVWVAGNVADLTATVIVAAAAGLKAAGAINADLIGEDTRTAVEHFRHSIRNDQESWEERYRAHPHIWSRRPNAQLVAHASGLAPGSALDLGCGEGADAIWLASRGWQVVAVDFSTTALERAVANAAEAGAEIAARITWVHADLTGWVPEPGRYDLVTSQFIHLPGDARRALFAAAAAAVAPGGRLLIAGHHVLDLENGANRPPVPGMFFTGEEVAASLDEAAWRVVLADAVERPAGAHEGDVRTVHDAVLVAERR